MDGSKVDVDALTATAWRQFREAIADALDGLKPGTSIQVTLEERDLGESEPPYLIANVRDDSIHLEISGEGVVPNGYWLTPKARRRLRRLGLHAPSDDIPNYWATYARSHVDHAASVAVSAFRDAFGVIHPAFLLGHGVFWRIDSQLPQADATPEPPISVEPINREHLDRLVDEVLTEVLGEAPARDRDGDIPIRAGSGVVFVGTDEHRPLVKVFAHLVIDVADFEVAEREVAVMNAKITGVKFVLQGDVVIASLTLAALPFAAEHVRQAVGFMCKVVSEHDAELALRIGGRVFTRSATPPGRMLDEDDVEDDIHPIMLTILQLDAEKPGSVRPKLAAKMCGYDAGLLLALIRWNEEQEIAWREARDEANVDGDAEEAEVCEIERSHAERTITMLRKALRKVVVRGAWADAD